jgi:hypothetical protein
MILGLVARADFQKSQKVKTKQKSQARMTKIIKKFFSFPPSNDKPFMSLHI